MRAAVRLSDIAQIPGDAHGCPGCAHFCTGPIIGASNNVFINCLGAARVNDPGIHAACCGPNTFSCAQGSENVFVNGKPLVRKGDRTAHCGGNGKTVTGSANVNCN